MRASRLALGSAIFIGATCLIAQPSAQRPRFDVVIANGRIVDGTGAPWFRGDVGITGDRISAIGALNAVLYDAARKEAPGAFLGAAALGTYVVLAPLVGAEQAYEVCCA